MTEPKNQHNLEGYKGNIFRRDGKLSGFIPWDIMLATVQIFNVYTRCTEKIWAMLK